MVESRHLLGNSVGDNARIFQGNITNVTNNFDADHAAADKAFLRKFSKTNPIDNKNRILESKGGLLDDSYRWILEHEQFTRWRNTENGGVLWIKGDPGKGKTMLLCGIIKEFDKDPEIRERSVYFFCQGTDNRTNTPTAIIRGLIYLFLRQHPGLLSRIREENKKEPDNFLEGDNERFALCRIFERVMEDPCITNPICIIDALDECQHEESLKSLFSLIVDTSRHVKWLLSSRNEKWIERGLRAVEEHQRLTLELRGNSQYISSAIKTYISHCIQDIHALKDDAELRHKTAELLNAKANSTFLWVTLVVKELHNTSHPHVEAVLQSMPEDLKELYDEIMKRAKKRWRADEHACLAILATVTAAKRPLLLEELYMFISPKLSQCEGKYNIHSVKGFVEACGSFISNEGDIIYFIHQSVKDYMIQKTNNTVFPSGIADQHYTMFEISMSEMNKTLKRNIYAIKSLDQDMYNLIPPDPNPLTPKEYYCKFWVEHLVEGCESQQSRPRECLRNNGKFHIFLRERYLHWLEAMVLLKSMTQAVTALLKLHALIISCLANESEAVQRFVSPAPTKRSMTRFFSWISEVTGLTLKSYSSGKQETNQILELTTDLYRAVSEHRATIEEFPLQIYTSVLVFSPMESSLRKTFEAAESPKWMAVKPIMRQKWGACLQTFEGRLPFKTSTISVSLDNKRLASIIHSRHIEVWDLTTGAFLQQFTIKRSAKSAALSSNGNRLALVSHHGVQIWDLVGGSFLKSIRQVGIKSATFIAGDEQLSILGPSFFKIHDLARNVDLQTYFGHPGERFRDVVFSSSCIQLVSGSNNGTLEAWDPAAWTLVPYFTNKASGVRLVVTCRQKKKTLLKVVDLVAREYVQTMLKRGGNSDKWLFFLTSDGMRLVVQHGYEMIRVWDLATGLWQTIGIPDKTLNLAAFSPCDMRLALANDDNVYVWDTASSEYRWAPTDHGSATSSMAFSPDGSRLALGTSDGTVKILEVTASKPLQSPEDRQDAITKMLYSPNGKWLASLSCNDVKLWDPNTGECMRTWRPSSNITSLGFSLDSARLAAGDDKGTINVCDVATGACNSTLTSAEYSHGYVRSNKERRPKEPIGTIFIISSSSELASVESGFSHSQGLIRSNKEPELSMDIMDNAWILWKDKRVIRLPPEYCPNIFAAHGDFCAIATHSHQVLFFQISFDG